MKYKHKKTGKIAIEVTTFPLEHYHIGDSFTSLLHKDLVEDSYDWEKIEEKDYEILTYKAIDKDNLVVSAMKRLSDGVEFKIGDKVAYCDQSTIYIIDKFTVKEDHMIAWCKISTNGHNSGAFNILNIRPYKEKKVLYTTEDGVDRYEWQEEYWIFKLIGLGSNDWKLGEWEGEGKPKEVNESNLPNKQGNCPSNRLTVYKIFSTKEAAEKWIKDSNALFTTQDGVKIFKGMHYYMVNKDNMKHVTEVLCDRDTDGSFGNVFTYFSTKQLAQKYIDDNTKYLLTEDEVKLGKEDKFYYAHKGDFISGRVGDLQNSEYPGKFFSTEEKAKEYILWNEPCLSLKDITYKGIWGDLIVNNNLNQLKEMAKTKTEK